MTSLSIRIDDKLKEEVEKISDDLWISLNQLVNLKLREFVETWEIHVNVYSSKEKIVPVKIKKRNNDFLKNSELS